MYYRFRSLQSKLMPYRGVRSYQPYSNTHYTRIANYHLQSI